MEELVKTAIIEKVRMEKIEYKRPRDAFISGKSS